MQHSHHRDELVGYSVEQTIQKGKVIPGHLARHRVEGAGRYLEALGLASDYRREGDGAYGYESYAVVKPIYRDGCIGSAF